MGRRANGICQSNELSLLILSFIKHSFAILFLFIHANILRTPLYMFDNYLLCRFFVPASTLEAHAGPNIEFHQVCSYAFLFAPSKPT